MNFALAISFLRNPLLLFKDLRTSSVLVSSKCEKNMLKLKRKPRTTRWTEEYQDIKKGNKK